MKHEHVQTSARMAGQVKRYHTWPNVRPQTTGEHMWQAMRIWWQIWGPMPPAVSTYLLWNDAGELVSGDVSFMAKRRSPALKKALDVLEEEAIAEMGGPKTFLISDYQKMQAKVCDLIEMLEYGLTELAFGNNFGEPIVAVTHVAVLQQMKKLTKVDRGFVRAYLKKMKKGAKHLKIPFGKLLG